LKHVYKGIFSDSAWVRTLLHQNSEELIVQHAW